MNAISSPLEAPGSGLPKFEAFLVKYAVFPLVSLTMSRPAAMREFLAEGRRALDLARSVDEAKLSNRVLIGRIRGIEDSSRNWSVAMTLEHLIIVGKGIRRTVDALNAGQVPRVEVSIADVKPDPATGPEILPAFENWLEEYESAGLLALPYPGEPRHTHPWFGAMTASQWLKLNAMHNGIHRRQIEKIIADL